MTMPINHSTYSDYRNDRYPPHDAVSSVFLCRRPVQEPPKQEFQPGFRYSTVIIVTPIVIGTEIPCSDRLLRTHRPRTPIGKALLALRRAYLESGGQLQDWDEIEAEVRKRRGGLDQD